MRLHPALRTANAEPLQSFCQLRCQLLSYGRVLRFVCQVGVLIGVCLHVIQFCRTVAVGQKSVVIRSQRYASLYK